MEEALMNLKILLPFKVFTAASDVKRVISETREGSFGILPHRLDCIAALTPGILIYETESEGEICVAIDEGILIKSGMEVLVSVRNAVGGTNAGGLREAVKREFINISESEKNIRVILAKLESGFIRRFTEFNNER